MEKEKWELKIMKELYEKLSDFLRKSNIRIMGIPKEKRLFKQIINENFPILWKELDSQIQEGNRTPNYLNVKRPSSRYIILKCQKLMTKNSQSRLEKKDCNQ